jgi:hypothetical protein
LRPILLGTSMMVEAAKKAEATAAQRLGYNPYQVLMIATPNHLVLHTKLRISTSGSAREENRE